MSEPSAKEEMTSAKGAAHGEKEPLDPMLEYVTCADASELNRFAMGTSFGHHPRAPFV